MVSSAGTRDTVASRLVVRAAVLGHGETFQDAWRVLNHVGNMCDGPGQRPLRELSTKWLGFRSPVIRVKLLRFPNR